MKVIKDLNKIIRKFNKDMDKVQPKGVKRV